MNDLDPNFLLPLWQELVSYFRHYRPLVQGEQNLESSRHAPAAGARGDTQ